MKLLNNKITKMSTIFFALLISNTVFFTPSCREVVENNTNMNHDNNECDSITKEIFFKIAREIKQQMDNHATFTVEKSIVLAKVYNTMHQAIISNDKTNVSFINDYKKVFLEKYLSQVNKQLECTFGKGMTTYSKKYDLYVGVGSVFRCRDIYTILN